MIKEVAADHKSATLDKRRALARLLTGTGATAVAAIPRRPDSGPAPLSFAQERLWFLDRWNPGSSVYNVPLTIRLVGALNLPALQQSLQTVIDRHEILRATFPDIEGQPVQVISDRSITPEIIDLSILQVHEREEEAARIALEQASLSFDLSRGPLARISVIKLNPEEHILSIVLHHIVTDAWSKGLLARELAALYRQFSEGFPANLGALSLRYADYAAWQRNESNEQVMERQLAYWQRQLADAPAVLDLPSDRPRPAVVSYSGARVTTMLPLDLGDRLETIGKINGATLFMTLLAGFQVLLHRYSGQQDVVVGTPVSNRSRSELEGIVGFFTNTLALRVDMSGDPSFGELLSRVRETCLGAYANQDIPFEKLVESLSPERSPAHTPLFQVMFIYQQPDLESAQLAGLRIEPIDLDRSISRFDLVLSLIRTGDGFETSLEYSTDLFDRVRMERLFGHYQTLLEGIARNPDERISRLPLLTELERQAIAQWNETGAELPGCGGAHELFEQQARLTPEAAAAEFMGESLSYRQLNERANRLANYLRSRGARPESIVALCAERSLEMLTGLLGILKSGATYMPIEPSNPPERIGFMCRDADVALVLTHGEIGDALAHVDFPVLPMSTDFSEFPAEDFDSHAGPEYGCYVIYTSGSTGVPKGVVMPHRAVINLLQWHRRVLPGSRRTLQFCSIGFDVSMQETLGTWACGGCVVPVTEAHRRDIPELTSLVERARVERMFIPPSVLQNVALFASETSGSLPTIADVITAGEALQITPEIREFFKTRGARLHNHYGPTETHACTGYTLPENPDEWPLLPSIGVPLINYQIHIMDSAMQPVPIGIPGEVYVGGIGVARGYLNRPDMTAERFVPDPFDPTTRLYRVGDLARYLPDGNIEFLGRADYQVKVRGFRIELGEIEQVLDKHPAVLESVVIVRGEGSDKRLAAYVAADKGAVTARELREHLRHDLPEYMVPASISFMDALPRNTNGKVNRKALPSDDPSSEETDADRVAPRNEVEEVLAEIWGQVLRVERPGVHDNFFDLGGHSLLATQLIWRIRNVFQIELPLRVLFESPTIAGVAGRLAAQESDSGFQTIPTVDRSRPLPLSFAQERLWFVEQLRPGPLLNFPIALRLEGMLDVGALRRALERIHLRHETLRTIFAIANGAPVQIVQHDAPLPFSTADVPESADIAELINEEAKQPFDLARGPVYRCRLLHLGDEEHVLVITFHHIVADETSAATFAEELSALYRAEIRSEEVALHQLPIQYADYAVWQREQFEAGRLRVQLDYWKARLATAPDFLEIPTDYPRPALPTNSRQSERFIIASDTLKKVALLCREETATHFMFFLAVWNVVLARLTGRTDILVGIDVLNRDRPETQNLIGFFINQLVIRTDVSRRDTEDRQSLSFRALLQCVRTTALEAYANQELPFNKLVEVLRPQRDTERPPLYQVKMAYTKTGGSAPEMEGLTASWVQADKGVAQLDMTLFLAERPDGVYCRLEYRDELFKSETAARIAKELESMVTAYAENPDQPIDLTSTRAPASSAPDRLAATRAKLLSRKLQQP